MLERVLDLEYHSTAAYTAAIPLLSGRAATAAKRFLDQDLTHAGELSGLVRDAGVKPPMPQPSYDLGHPRSVTDVLELLHAVERNVIAAYLDAIPRLAPGSVRSAVASLLANEAQHVAVLRATLGRPPVPFALVTGKE
jgi:hypothetical protein